MLRYLRSLRAVFGAKGRNSGNSNQQPVKATATVTTAATLADGLQSAVRTTLLLPLLSSPLLTSPYHPTTQAPLLAAVKIKKD